MQMMSPDTTDVRMQLANIVKVIGQRKDQEGLQYT